jgi:putative DNA primase/helicase
MIDLASILTENGIISTELSITGNLQRARCSCKPNSGPAAWFKVHLDEPVSVSWGCWRCNKSGNWFGRQRLNDSRTKAVALNLYVAHAMQLKRNQAHCISICEQIWATATKARDCHVYLKRKLIPAVGGIKFHRGALFIPLFDVHGNIQGASLIYPNGSKRYISGTNKRGHYFPLGSPRNSIILIAEGYATGVSLHLATGHAVAIAFDAGNIAPVSTELRKKYYDYQLVVCADNDETGINAARQAINVSSGKLIVPYINPQSGKDWNDLHLAEGLHEVNRQLEEAGVSRV